MTSSKSQIIKDTENVIRHAQKAVNDPKVSLNKILFNVIVTWMKSPKIASDAKALHGKFPKSYTNAFDYFMAHKSTAMSKDQVADLLKKTQDVLTA